MPELSTRLPAALSGLEQILDTPRKPGVALGNWRWLVRQRIVAVRAALIEETAGGGDGGWLAARGGDAFRERNDLLTRLAALGPEVLDAADAEGVRVELKRLVAEIRRHAGTPRAAGPPPSARPHVAGPGVGRPGMSGSGTSGPSLGATRRDRTHRDSEADPVG